MLKRMTMVALALAMVVTACGDDDAAGTSTVPGTTQQAGGLSSSEKAIANLIAEGMMEGSDADNPFSQPAAATCFSEGAVADLGVARLAEIGIAVDSGDTAAAFASLSEDEINGLADLALGCVDIETAMAPQFAGDGISEASALCMATELGKTDFYRQAFIAGMTGDETYDPTDDPEFLGLMGTVAVECLTEDELTLIMGG